MVDFTHMVDFTFSYLVNLHIWYIRIRLRDIIHIRFKNTVGIYDKPYYSLTKVLNS